MYSLGAVLVEIGYRRTLRELFAVTSSFSDPGPNEARTNHEILVKYARRLGDKMGSKYAQVAVDCLTKTTERGKPTDELRNEFYHSVLRPLGEILDGMKTATPVLAE
ncbi:hypothetical protein NM688_g8775 [Phlebia brevispora]|uniref:Uncharacterized protein n=1 Tax=Phlebia brevispora TaxID=194682 RepID=A0ACC1RQ52_9APHY|nr:hypothetical protein NM688_g8775 [Phlebia brevispora]